MASKLVVPVALMAFVVTASAVADEPKAPEFVDRVLRTAGGRDKLLKLFRIRERLNVSSDPEKEGKIRESVLEPPENWWIGKKQRDEEEPARYLAWAWTLGVLTDPDSKFEVLPEIEEGGKPAFGLRVTGSVDPPMDLYFDKAENLLVRIDRKSGVHRVSEWTEHDGVKYPAKCVGYKRNGKPWYFSEILELERLETLPDGLSRVSRAEGE